MYKVMGTDGKEYGPVSAEVLRDWIAQRRANGQTRVQAEGSADWKALSELPDFTAALANGGRFAPAPLSVEEQARLATAGLDGAPPWVIG